MLCTSLRVCFLIASCLLLRLAPDQHNTRFESRSKLVLRNFDIAKMPLDDLAKAAPTRLADVSKDPSKLASSEQQTPDAAAMEAAATEAMELGLASPSGKNAQKETAAKAKSRAKKRTQEEIAADEYKNAQETFDGLINTLPAMFDGKAFGNELGKVDRALQKKLRDANDNHWFDIKEPLKTMCTQLEIVRKAVKVGKNFSGGAAAAKKWGKDFFEAMHKVAEQVPTATGKPYEFLSKP